ncbi:hypothetical protein GLOTRDRAFT_90341 [Gloeophyllum trabeum ATCC 11539]|uniref:Uncharacterized protein n=1 Tax=Gloeophyllum trabeum (strain ATCC 11539 / FP-39264 / Madison 617) TaxID=670483 RepID=S7QNE3_GLOTA|nr:uncharacterized protein GLOTRDRAFT_90341 [Gloeophyllum trabeum ATCC 11539]EPQ61041.1 hypothetical protein GLOTRDRAFT_90341 [Gloeophyllum trabeum ATCC 11539]
MKEAKQPPNTRSKRSFKALLRASDDQGLNLSEARGSHICAERARRDRLLLGYYEDVSMREATRQPKQDKTRWARRLPATSFASCQCKLDGWGRSIKRVFGKLSERRQVGQAPPTRFCRAAGSELTKSPMGR